MLSRLSSFSGPFSKTFKPVGGFTLTGLILRYEFSDSNSYSGGNSVTDLVGNSNGTLTNGPTFSGNGYLNLDGSNDFIITDTSLSSEFTGSYPNISEITSIFMWVYLEDNGVLITELGAGNILSGWHATNIEMTSSGLRFGLWGGVSIGYVTSTIPVSLRNWYYVGLTYDGSKITAWVNGQNAGQGNFDRSAPYNNNISNGLFYALGLADITNMGDGTYANFKLGSFHVYNIALSSQQVVNNYNSTKNNYIYTEDLLIWIDANDPESFSGGNIFDISGNYFTHSFGIGATSAIVDGVKCFDCNGTTNSFIRVDGNGPTLSSSGYTYVSWAKISSTSSNWRTLYRSAPNDHSILVQTGTDNLGFYDNDTNNFQDSGYDVTSIENTWVQYSVVGDSSSSVFYINGSQVGSVAFGAGGNRHDYFGGITGQPFGYIGNMILYNKKLTAAQIKQNYDALKNLYPSIVTNGLLMRLDANNSISYSGAGTIWYDVAGTQQNMTLVGNPTFVSGNISYFDFNGSNQYATGSGVTIPASSYTKSVWFWIDVYTDNNIVSGYDGVGGHFLYMAGTNKIIVGHHNQSAGFSTYQSTATISLNTWYNVTVTFDTIVGFKIYINGVIDSTHNMTSAHLGSGTTNLAAYANSGGNYLNGRISKVYTYDRVLTDTEILTNFNSDRSIFGL